jgi:hypothetical protein
MKLNITGVLDTINVVMGKIIIIGGPGLGKVAFEKNWKKNKEKISECCKKHCGDNKEAYNMLIKYHYLQKKKDSSFLGYIKNPFERAQLKELDKRIPEELKSSLINIELIRMRTVWDKLRFIVIYYILSSRLLWLGSPIAAAVPGVLLSIASARFCSEYILMPALLSKKNKKVINELDKKMREAGLENDETAQKYKRIVKEYYEGTFDFSQLKVSPKEVELFNTYDERFNTFGKDSKLLESIIACYKEYKEIGVIEENTEEKQNTAQKERLSFEDIERNTEEYKIEKAIKKAIAGFNSARDVGVKQQEQCKKEVPVIGG